MVQFLLLPFFHPVVNGTDFLVALHDGHADPVLHWGQMRGVLHGWGDTFLDESTSLIGKRPPVRLRTYLSVTYDFRLMTADFFVWGTCGRYFHSSSLIIRL
jgi:hypothetical protein